MGDLFSIREIQPQDDSKVAEVIKVVMTEFGATGQGFAIHDPEVTHMAQAYSSPKSRYWVVTQGDLVVGGGGVAPLQGAADGVCELRKMYFLKAARGTGMGSRLLHLALAAAKKMGYEQCYLETLTGMDDAKRLYAKFGFTALPAAMGKTGHFGCDKYFVKVL